MKKGKYVATNGMKNINLRTCLSTTLKILKAIYKMTAMKYAMISIILEEKALMFMATITDKHTNYSILD